MHKATRNSRHSDFNLQSDFKNIREALADATYDVKGRVGEILAQSLKDVKTRSLDASDTLADYISEKPFKSLGIAAGVGFLLGLLVRTK